MKTTIILGAGASVDYGFPTGADLIGNTINFLNHPELNQQIYSDLALKIHGFSNVLERADPTSIDSFLTMHSKNKDFVDLGKKLIAAQIINCQKPEMFTARNAKNWYKYLYNYICYDNYKILDADEFNIITFNYDLSLEYYFDSKLEQDPNLSQSDRDNLFQKFQNKIHHVYGSVYEYTQPIKVNWESDTRSQQRFSSLREYSCNKQYSLMNLIKETPSLIKVVGEDRSLMDDKTHLKFIEYLHYSDRVFVLGFGFDRANIEILELNQAKSPKANTRKIFYTNYNHAVKINSIVDGLPFQRAGIGIDVSDFFVTGFEL